MCDLPGSQSIRYFRELRELIDYDVGFAKNMSRCVVKN